MHVLRELAFGIWGSIRYGAVQKLLDLQPATEQTCNDYLFRRQEAAALPSGKELTSAFPQCGTEAHNFSH